MIVGPINNSMIHMNLAGRLRRFVVDVFGIDAGDTDKIIADFYWSKGGNVGIGDFNELFEIIYRKHNPPIVIRDKFAQKIEPVIKLFQENGWNEKEFDMMLLSGTKYVIKMRKKWRK